MPRIPSRYGQDMPSNPLIHGKITDICDIIIYKRGTVNVTNTMRGYRERDEHASGAIYCQYRGVPVCFKARTDPKCVKLSENIVLHVVQLIPGFLFQSFNGAPSAAKNSP